MRIIIDINGNEVTPPHIVPKKEKPSTTEDDLKLRILNQDAMPEDEKLKLESAIVLHVRNLLKKKQKGTVVSFLKSIKDSMSPELKDLLSEEIKLM